MNFGDSFLTIVQPTCALKTLNETFSNLAIWINQAAVVSNFCLIGKSHHSFMVPRMIELVNWTFMPTQSEFP